MKKQHVFVLVVLWAVLTGFAWFSPAKEMSDSERRPLAQFPGVSLESVTDGKFMKNFESYSLDQFPLRDGFRTIKSLFHYRVLGQKADLHIGIAGNCSRVCLRNTGQHF